MLLELIEIEISILGKWFSHIAIELMHNRRQNHKDRVEFHHGIGAHRAEAQIGIAVGNTFYRYGIPKNYTGFGTLPNVVHNFLPQWFVEISFSITGLSLWVEIVVCMVCHQQPAWMRHQFSPTHWRPSPFGHLGVDKRFTVRIAMPALSINAPRLPSYEPLRVELL